MRGIHAGVLLTGALLATAPAFAERPAWAGKKGEAREVRGGGHFTDSHRVVVREYYFKEHGRGFCPPGLAKKRNGCLPPGQAKKWRVGRPLPRELIFYDLPPSLVVEIGPAPAGHRFVRVAADILLIAIGTGMVIDAIEDLGRR